MGSSEKNIPYICISVFNSSDKSLHLNIKTAKSQETMKIEAVSDFVSNLRKAFQNLSLDI